MQEVHATPQTKLSYFGTIKPSVLLVWRASPRFFLALLSITLFSSLVSPATILINSKLFGILALAIRKPEADSGLVREIMMLLVSLGVVTVLGQVLNGLGDAVQRLFQKRAANYVQGILVEKTAAMDLAFFEDPAFHDQMQKASSEAGSRPMMIVQQLMQVASSLTIIISLGSMVLLWHVWILPVILLSPLLLMRLSASIAAEEVNLIAKRIEIDRKAQYLKTVLTDDAPAKEVRLFSLRPFLLSRLRGLWAEIYNHELQLAKGKLLSRGVLGAILSLDRPLLIGYAVMQLLQRQITFGKFSLYTQSIFALQSGFRALATALAQLHESHLFAANLFRFLSLQPEVEAPRIEGAAKCISATPHIEFRNVSFRYPNTDSLVLNDVSFALRPGEVVALAGENGSGKTTIVKLLAGLYEPIAGQILLDGVDIVKLDREKLRSYFSMTLQDFRIYNFPVYENIGIGSLEFINNKTEIEAAARQTGLDKIVQALPHKYDTVLGRQFKRGHEFSGGRRQLVALSRALIRNAPILVMDEPTAALDVHNERHFFHLLLSKRRSSTQSVLLITHRMTAVRHAQRILVLESGKLVEEGAHDDLMARQGHYSKMFNAQVKMYGESWLNEADGFTSEPSTFAVHSTPGS